MELRSALLLLSIIWAGLAVQSPSLRLYFVVELVGTIVMEWALGHYGDQSHNYAVLFHLTMFAILLASCALVWETIGGEYWPYIPAAWVLSLVLYCVVVTQIPRFGHTNVWMLSIEGLIRFVLGALMVWTSRAATQSILGGLWASIAAFRWHMLGDWPETPALLVIVSFTLIGSLVWWQRYRIHRLRRSISDHPDRTAAIERLAHLQGIQIRPTWPRLSPLLPLL